MKTSANVKLTRKDGYLELNHKSHLISYWKGVYTVEGWFRDNEFETFEAAKEAIDDEITGGNPFK